MCIENLVAGENKTDKPCSMLILRFHVNTGTSNPFHKLKLNMCNYKKKNVSFRNQLNLT